MTWLSNDLTVRTGAPTAIFSPAAYPFVRQKTQHVIYQGFGDGSGDGQVHELWWDGHWHHNNLTSQTDAPLIAGEPWGYVYEDQPGGSTQHVVYQGLVPGSGPDGRVQEIWWDDDKNHHQLTSGVPPLVDRPLLAGLALAAPASAGPGRAARRHREGRAAARAAGDASARGRDGHAAGMRRVVVRELDARARAAERRRAGTTRCTCSASCARARRLGRSSAVQLTGQVAGLYVPRTGRSTCSARVAPAARGDRSRGRARPSGRALPAHPRPLRTAAARPRRRARRPALVEGDATEVQSRYIAALSPLDLSASSVRTLDAVPRAPAGRDRAVPRAPADLPVYRGTGVRARPARARRAAAARPRLPHPPRTTAAVLDPARYLAGDPPAQAVRLPAGSYRFTTSFGAEDRCCPDRAGRASRRVARRAAGLARRASTPSRHPRCGGRGGGAEARAAASATIAFNGRLVCVRIAARQGFSTRPSCR